MRKIKLFESWPPSALTHLSYKMQTKEHSYNDKIVLMGEAVREIYLIVDGDISLTSKVKVSMKAHRRSEAFFGIHLFMVYLFPINFAPAQRQVAPD